MKKFIFGALAALSLTSCAMTLPYAVTNNAVGEKTGISKTNVFFGATGAWGGNIATGIVTNKNFGVIEAAKKGKITVIGSVDVKTTNYFLFQKVEVIVTGSDE
jgi:hypothetical protein